MYAFDSLRLSTLAIPFLIFAVILTAIQYFFTVQKDTREPPFIQPRLPVIGHLLGLVRNGSDYYYFLDKRYSQKIYTMPIFKARMYIITSPDWAIAIHRAHKTLYFNTLIAQAIKTLFCFDQPTMDLVNYNLNGENGTREGVMLEIHDMLQGTLAPGPHLDDLNKSILNNVTPDLNSLARSGPQRMQLWQWLRHHFSLASVGALWGPNNPFKLHPEAEAAFWEFEAHAMPLSMMPYPQLFARKGYLARQKVLDAFHEYMKAERYNEPGVSQLVKNRATINLDKYKMSVKMHAYGDVTMVFGAIVNTVPIAFWLISRIFEDRELLSDVRAEVDKCVSTPSAPSKKRLMNTTKLRSTCPLLSSALREILRLMAAVNSNRYVVEDTTISNHATGESYLLKKDSVVQIASNVIHSKPLWGSDASSFNPRRFLSTGEKAKSDTNVDLKPQDPAAPFRDGDGKLHSSAFRSFGGGNNICPGRYFAQVEILGLASLFIAGFEIENAGGGGQYTAPPEETFKLSMSAVKPGKDVDVVVKRRKGYEDVEWEFET